ncbi:MAG: hypothetical protein RIS70_1643 [Planctomycetota bacterium]
MIDGFWGGGLEFCKDFAVSRVGNGTGNGTRAVACRFLDTANRIATSGGIPCYGRQGNGSLLVPPRKTEGIEA